MKSKLVIGFVLALGSLATSAGFAQTTETVNSPWSTLRAGNLQPGPVSSPNGTQPVSYLAEEPAPNGNRENGEAEKEKDEGFKLFNFPVLTERGFDIRGWIDQSFTYNPGEPLDRFNGPVTFNDRSNDYQMNQLYLIAERATKTEERDWDLGGRVDLLYGTDHRFTTAVGLEDTWNQGSRFYGLAMPQLYGDFAFRKWVFRFGHFYTLHGYEVVRAPDNFFLTHAYTMQYGEPFTHTGMMALWQWNERLSFAGGILQGWDNWTDANRKASFTGGFNWTSESKRTALAWALTVGNEQAPGIPSTRTFSSVVLTQRIGEKWNYVFENDYGYETNVGGGGTDARWHSFVNYLFYEFNEKWSLGARYEWFTDVDGTRVAGIGIRDGMLKGIPLTAIPARWQEATVGINYKYNKNVTLRSGARWDWAFPIRGANWVDGQGNPAEGPFNDFSQRRQFLWDMDMIVAF
jgi:hypothetical protein